MPNMLTYDNVNTFIQHLYTQGLLNKINVSPVCTDLSHLTYYIQSMKEGRTMTSFNFATNQTEPFIEYESSSKEIIIPIFIENHFVMLYGNDNHFLFIDPKGDTDFNKKTLLNLNRDDTYILYNMNEYILQNQHLDPDDIFTNLFLEFPTIEFSSYDDIIQNIGEAQLELQLDCQSRSSTKQLIEKEVLKNPEHTFEFYPIQMQNDDWSCGYYILYNIKNIAERSKPLESSLSDILFKLFKLNCDRVLSPLNVSAPIPPPLPPRPPKLQSPIITENTSRQTNENTPKEKENYKTDKITSFFSCCIPKSKKNATGEKQTLLQSRNAS